MLSATIYRLGVIFPDARRVQLQESRDRLATSAGCSPNSIRVAIDELVRIGFLHIHEAVQPRTADAFSIPLFQNLTPSKVEPVPRFRRGSKLEPLGGVVGTDPSLISIIHDQDLLPNQPPFAPADTRDAEWVDWLESIGVADPHRWVTRYGFERMSAEWDRLERTSPREVVNLVGLFRTRLDASLRRDAAAERAR